MRCTVAGCPGQYEERKVAHTVRQDGELMVFDNVPAEVCDICSDTLLAPETIDRLETLLKHHPETSRHAPVFAYSD